ncbi:hypothetical protein Pan161_16880 [Gimesia algae]|uniref:Methyltransferase domain-containing protein n=2 Tax=Gimesia algae TaxID=2527971 RepID=A0A517VAM3_9PLAN|nr:hypothetical protein Pan161_16880 [Gimesia algae]
MDQPGLSEGEHSHALAGLGRINWWSRSDAIVWPVILELARRRTGKPLQILDIASGGGDVALSIAARAKRAGISVEVDGCDISPFAVKYATQQASNRGQEQVRFFECDVLSESLDKQYDVVMCSLFLHHLDEEPAQQLLKIMSQSTRQLMLVNDLRRSRAGYGLAWTACRLLTRSSVVHTDGPLSVAGAFTVNEITELAGQAGLSGFQVTRHWPQRWLLKWSRV